MVKRLVKYLFPQPKDVVDDPRMSIIVGRVKPDDDVLDIGCVQHDADKAQLTGWLHEELDNKASNVTGLDYLEEEVEELKNQGCNVVCADAESFDLEKKFDTVVAGELIEHLSNPGEFLNRVHEHLKTGGRLLLSTPNPFGAHRLIDAIFGEVSVNPEHTCYFDAVTIRQILDRHGFDVVSLWYAQPTYYAPAHSYMNLHQLLMKPLYWSGFEQLGSTTIVVEAKKR